MFPFCWWSATLGNGELSKNNTRFILASPRNFGLNMCNYYSIILAKVSVCLAREFRLLIWLHRGEVGGKLQPATDGRASHRSFVEYSM